MTWGTLLRRAWRLVRPPADVTEPSPQVVSDPLREELERMEREVREWRRARWDEWAGMCHRAGTARRVEDEPELFMVGAAHPLTGWAYPDPPPGWFERTLTPEP